MNKQELLSAVVAGMVAILCTSGTVKAESHDVAWTFGNVSSSSYRLDTFEPADAGLGASIGTQDPTLTLQIGKRYQVTVTNYLPHPFEVIAKGASAGADVVLLSMGSRTGPFESDPEVAWVDNGSGIVTFTLSLGLYNAMIDSGHVPGYRCKAHIFTMRGDFDVLPADEPGPEPLEDPIPEPIAKGTVRVELETVASGLIAPVYLTHAADGTDRLFVVDQPGTIWLIEN
jgi:hypothetical protein